MKASWLDTVPINKEAVFYVKKPSYCVWAEMALFCVLRTLLWAFSSVGQFR